MLKKHHSKIKNIGGLILKKPGKQETFCNPFFHIISNKRKILRRFWTRIRTSSNGNRHTEETKVPNVWIEGQRARTKKDLQYSIHRENKRWCGWWISGYREQKGVVCGEEHLYFGSSSCLPLLKSLILLNITYMLTCAISLVLPICC